MINHRKREGFFPSLFLFFNPFIKKSKNMVKWKKER